MTDHHDARVHTHDPTDATFMMSQRLHATAERLRVLRQALAHIEELATEALADAQARADCGRVLRPIATLARESLAEQEPTFHCYSCHQDKPFAEQGEITNATCRTCEEASSPRLHPELYDSDHPEAMAAFQSERARRKAACARCHRRTR